MKKSLILLGTVLTTMSTQTAHAAWSEVTKIKLSPYDNVSVDSIGNGHTVIGNPVNQTFTQPKEENKAYGSNQSSLEYRVHWVQTSPTDYAVASRAKHIYVLAGGPLTGSYTGAGGRSIATASLTPNHGTPDYFKLNVDTDTGGNPDTDALPSTQTPDYRSIGSDFNDIRVYVTIAASGNSFLRAAMGGSAKTEFKGLKITSDTIHMEPIPAPGVPGNP